MLITVYLCNLVMEGDIDSVRSIVNHRSDLHSLADYDQRTPLHIAASSGDYKIAQYLISKGAKINALDRWNKTPLFEAIISKKKKVVEVLL